MTFHFFGAQKHPALMEALNHRRHNNFENVMRHKLAVGNGATRELNLQCKTFNARRQSGIAILGRCRVAAHNLAGFR